MVRCVVIVTGGRGRGMVFVVRWARVGDVLLCRVCDGGGCLAVVGVEWLGMRGGGACVMTGDEWGRRMCHDWGWIGGAPWRGRV